MGMEGGERMVVRENGVKKSSVDSLPLDYVLQLIKWSKNTFPWWETTLLSHTKSHRTAWLQVTKLMKSRYFPT
jgi:hypothetical protein